MRRKKHVLILFLLFICISIGYAFLNIDISVGGKSNIKKSTWNIHFDNINLKSGSVTDNLPEWSGNTITVNTTLSKPGDYYSFTFDIVNEGTLDAIIDSINIDANLTYEQSSYVKLIGKYANGAYLNESQNLFAGESKTVKVIVEFDGSELTEEILPEEDFAVEASITITYVQSNLNSAINFAGEVIYPEPGISIYNALNSACDSGECVHTGDYVIYFNDLLGFLLDENGKALNIKNTFIEEGKSYEIIVFSVGMNVTEEKFLNKDYVTSFIDISNYYEKHDSYFDKVGVFNSTSDTYKNILYSIYPANPLSEMLFEDYEQIEALNQELIGEYILGFPTGQEVGCGTYAIHRFFWLTDEDGTLIKLTDNIKNLSNLVVNKLDIPEDSMTWEEAKVEMNNRLDNMLNN